VSRAVPPTVQPARHAINFAWLVRLRWAALAAQAVTVVVADRALAVPLPVGDLLVVIGVAVATNVGCELWARSGRPLGERHIGGVMVADVLFLTALLFLAGGPFNPFSFLYLVQIALAAVVLPARWTWLLVALSMAGSAFLFVDHRPLEMPAKTHDEHMRWHLQGMWVAFAVAAGFIVYFLMRVLRALGERERQLGEAQARGARQERVAALATLAGGAAHELATPLSTIATVARELERRLADQPADVHEDLRLLRGQVDRCRAILDQMSGRAGAGAGEGPEPVALDELARAATADLPARPAVRVDVVAAGPVRLPRRAMAQALRVLVANAQEASPPEGEVVLRARVEGGDLCVEVEDRGAGMTPEVLARVGEPFYTTKPPGRGMGLGLFLTRAVVEQLGGALELDSHAGRGTTARVRVPLGGATLGSS
jgi:two-component system sensor histidine kinase RegB